MFLIPKKDLYDSCFSPKVIFTKGEKYEIEDECHKDGIHCFVLNDNFQTRNFISLSGEYINNFLIG